MEEKMTEEQQIAKAIEESKKEAENRVCVDDPPFGLIRHNIKDDGHCLFGAIGHFVGKDALVVRREICSWLRENIYDIDSKEILKLLLSNPLTEEKDNIMIIDYKQIAHEFIITDQAVRRHVNNYIEIMEKTDGGVKSYGGEVEIMAAAFLYRYTIILFYNSKSGYKYKMFPMTDKLILLFNCKLNEASPTANHWESLKLDTTKYSTIHELIETYSFRKVKSNRKVKTPLFTKKRYQKRII